MKIRSHLKYLILGLVLLVLPLSGWAQGEAAAGKAAAAGPASAAPAKKASSKKQAKKKAKKAPASIEKEVTVGVYALDDPSYRYGKYSDLTDNGVFGLFDFKLDRRPDPASDDTTRWRLEGKRLGLDSRRLEFDYWQQGKQRFRFDFREIPNNRFNDGQTPYRHQTNGSWALPWDWSVNRYNATTKGFLNLQSSLTTMKIDTLRRRFDAAYGLKLGGGWRFDIDYLHETKIGNRTLGGIFGYGFNNARSVILPAPVDYKTDNVEATFGYAGPRMQVNMGIYASFFRNADNTLVFQNAYAHEHEWNDAVSYPDSQGRIALEPDNHYIQYRASVGFNLTSGMRLTSDAAVGTMKQNDTLLPYTINPDLLVQTPVPLSKLDGKIDTSMLNLRFTSRLARRLGLRVNYHYDKRDNKTPQALFPYIGADSQDQRDTALGRFNLPYSYTRKKSDALVTYRISRIGRLRAGVEYFDYKRDFQEVRSSDELAWRAGLTLRGWSMASVNFDYRNSSRDVSNYIANAPLLASYPAGTYGQDDFQNHPLLRKYFLTDRDRDEYRLRADFFPDPRVNLGVSASYDKDDYGSGHFGLNTAKVRSWTIDAGLYPRDNVTLAAFYTWEKYNANQSSRYITSTDSVTDPANDWFADSEDRVDTWNVTLTFKDIGKDKGWKGVEAGMDYTYSKTDSSIDVTAVSEATAPLPDLLSKQEMFSIWSRFALGGHSSIRLSAQSAKLTSRDWALDGVEPDTVSRVLLPGQAAANYDLWLVSAAWTYRF